MCMVEGTLARPTGKGSPNLKGPKPKDLVTKGNLIWEMEAQWPPIESTLVPGPIEKASSRSTNSLPREMPNRIVTWSRSSYLKSTVKETSTLKQLEERTPKEKESSPDRMLILKILSPEIRVMVRPDSNHPESSSPEEEELSGLPLR
ncbi:UNVERIFIED_CONTAM: hypothetical protein Slati_0170800 [Sesamum latifolium]|uniref:Uncharacterized protein n=1 Tax=Sesamum latifolium TaxID=2727402 RepID=A0AAW2YBK1_9LAMI